MPRLLCVFAPLIAFSAFCADEAPPRPVLKDFLGLCTHTIQFRPKLYQPICRLARDYHPVEWDLGQDSDHKTEFPWARNKVNWETVYGSWKEAGFDAIASLMFESIPQEKWNDVKRDAHAYGKAFAQYFGPSGEKKLLSAVEIGNEPGKWDDASYRIMLEHMSKGLREGDPKLKILTCNLTAGKSHEYAKSVECLKGLESSYDILNIHVYAMVEGWPTWRRSFPEDPKITYLKEVRDVVAWRDKNAPGKPLWITEYGWDCTTKKPDPKTEFAKWEGVTDKQQAQWLVRSTLIFMGMDVERAYIYWFNDSDQPSLHASSGITRDWKPKPSYWALGHLYKNLADYRFSRIVKSVEGEASIYEFVHSAEGCKRVLAIWSPTGSERNSEASVDLEGAKLLRAERMPLKEGDVPPEQIALKDGKAVVKFDESPIYLFLEK
ncbi:MAG TPA: hypothetical protein VEJ63_00965 [Planctomycetota bacterium]|nr:hypothetical protein [Planctomycetota bacterium]